MLALALEARVGMNEVLEMVTIGVGVGCKEPSADSYGWSLDVVNRESDTAFPKGWSGVKEEGRERRRGNLQLHPSNLILARVYNMLKLKAIAILVQCLHNSMTVRESRTGWHHSCRAAIYHNSAGPTSQLGGDCIH